MENIAHASRIEFPDGTPHIDLAEKTLAVAQEGMNFRILAEGLLGDLIKRLCPNLPCDMRLVGNDDGRLVNLVAAGYPRTRAEIEQFRESGWGNSPAADDIPFGTLAPWKKEAHFFRTSRGDHYRQLRVCADQMKALFENMGWRVSVAR